MSLNEYVPIIINEIKTLFILNNDRLISHASIQHIKLFATNRINTHTHRNAILHLTRAGGRFQTNVID